MAAVILQQGDRVVYKAGSKKMKGTVVDHLPVKPQKEVPILKKKKVVWMDRKLVRKLPCT